MKQVVIEGKNILDIDSFYDEINRVFMQEEDWQLGKTLDGFNDLLYGGFGLIGSGEEISLLWRDFPLSKKALGYEVTRAYYQEKLAPGSPYNRPWFEQQLAALAAGQGKTYFDNILEIISTHANIHLVED